MTLMLPPDKLSDAEKYEKILASDPAYDGRFYFGVVTTGVFCRPSCKVRKPLRKNVRFFTAPEEASSAGFRACRRCYPDALVAAQDIEREEVEALVAEIRSDPAAFPDIEALVARSGYGATHLFETFHRVLGQTPAAVLNGVRVEHALRLLTETREPVLNVALASGYRSVSAFHRHFRLATGVTPSAFRNGVRCD